MSQPKAWIGVYTDNDRIDLYVDPEAMRTLDPHGWGGVTWGLSFSPQGMVFEVSRANLGPRFFFEEHLGQYRANFRMDEVRNSHLLVKQWPRGATKMPLQAVIVEPGVLIGSQPEAASLPRDRTNGGAPGCDKRTIRVMKADGPVLREKVRALRARQLEDGCYSAATVAAFVRLMGEELNP